MCSVLRASALCLAAVGFAATAHAETPPWDANHPMPVGVASPAAPSAAPPSTAATTTDAALTKPRFNVGVALGGNGIGVSGSYLLNDYIVLRGQAEFAPLNFNYTDGAAEYQARTQWSSLEFFTDVHPFKNGWMVSAGVTGGTRRVTVTATPVSSRFINGSFYSPTQIASVTGKLELANPSADLGIGFDSSVHGHQGLTYRWLAGVTFSSDPKTSFTATGTAATDANVRSYLAQQSAQLRQDASIVRVLPLLQAGLGYNF